MTTIRPTRTASSRASGCRPPVRRKADAPAIEAALRLLRRQADLPEHRPEARLVFQEVVGARPQEEGTDDVVLPHHLLGPPQQRFAVAEGAVRCAHGQLPSLPSRRRCCTTPYSPIPPVPSWAVTS
jgi:hypothetical protein